MKRRENMRGFKIQFLMWIGVAVGLGGCETPQFPTVNIYDSPERFVRLEVYDDGSDGRGYSHPAYISEETMAKVMKGVYVQFGKSGRSSRRAFNDKEIKFFAPLWVRGFSQATPEEVVTFYETAEISELYEITTSGGVFVKDKAIHVVLSNYSVRTQIWQDNDEYRAPFRLRPLNPIEQQPGRLVFDPPQLMIPQTEKSFASLLKSGRPWQVGVLYQELNRQKSDL